MKYNKTRAISSELIEETMERLKGQDKKWCVGDEPRDQFFVSNLSPGAASQYESTDVESRTRPSSIGIRLKPRVADSVDINISFDIYYPSFPSYTEFQDMTAYQKQRLGSGFYRKISVTHEDTVKLSRADAESTRLTDELNTRVHNQIEEAISDGDVIDPSSIPSEDVDRLADAQSDEVNERFESVCESLHSSYSGKLNWNLELNINQYESEVEFQLVNRETDGESHNFVFNPAVDVYGESFEEYEFNMLPEDYRYNQTMWAKGLNCSTSSSAHESGRIIRTDSTPRNPTYEFEFNKRFDTAFKSLQGSDCIETLEDILMGMKEYHRRWVDEELIDASLGEKERIEYSKAANRFETEIQQYETGLNILREYPDVLRAFQLMNTVNDRQHDFDSWRLFQLVFIVSNVSKFASREYENVEGGDVAEVLWFPTGGGKTEAYIGLVLVNLFFDRLRGKDSGVTSWIRFPLRLLSRQQTTRFLESLMVAEEVRKSQCDGQGDEFSLGYFVGGRDTPNSIGDQERELFSRDQSILQEECQVISQCPLCSSDVDVEYIRNENSVYHICSSDTCVGRLPLYVTDRDIYRRCPSVLLGSLDKIAIVGFNPRFANLIGNYTSWCPTHGWGYSGKCSEYSICEEELEDCETDEAYDPVPTLHLVDEIHLLNEELGTFSAHYETMYQTLCEQVHNETPSVVTSTATIEESSRQIRNLFMLEENRFPVQGPAIGESFYGSLNETKVEREYIGVTPNNKSHTYAVLEFAETLHQVIQDFRELTSEELANRAGLSKLTTGEKTQLLSKYETSVVYFKARTDKDRYRTSINRQVNDNMERKGYEPLETAQLTSDSENLDILEDLENIEDTPSSERIDTVAATSFIGHGVDIDALNLMLFYGFPDQTFQYIQSSSRVGRKADTPGYVVDIFRPHNQRDRHRFKYFGKTHEHLNRAVEPVPLDRWSKFGVKRTFPGIAMGLLLQYYRPKLYREEDMNIQSLDDFETIVGEEDTAFTQTKFNELLESAYCLESDNATNYYDNYISQKTNSVWDYWVNETYRMQNVGLPDEAPMRSLRDIGDQKDINLSQAQIRFKERLTR